MKTFAAWTLLALSPLVVGAAPPWQEITMPTVAEAAAAFPQPPKEFGAIYWATGFPPPKERIPSDIEHLAANGGSVYMINAGGRSVKFLSPEYFDLMKVSIDELKKRGFKMWIDGDDGYPDGFAGGMISKLHPQLGMQAIVADARFTVAGGQTISMPLPVDSLGILANLVAAPTPNGAGAPAPAPAAPRGGGGGARAGARGNRGGAVAAPTTIPAAQTLPIPADGQFKWTAPTGGIWYVTFQGSVGEARYSVASGQTLTIPLPLETKSIQSSLRSDWRPGQLERREGGPATMVLPLPAGGDFTWTAPAGGTWEVTFVRHVYRSSPTRFGQRDDGTRDKDSLYSLIDYLDPEATAAYIKLVPETYGKYFGDEFGKTIMGFRGDETDFTGFIPWTPKLLETFQKQKGYDLKPYIAHFFAHQLTPEAQRVKADYFDVWSEMFRDNFYKPMQEWCRAHGMDYMMHLNHEEIMLRPGGGESMTNNEGSFFRDMRYMGVPGVDNLSQIRPGTVADFPKLAGSAAHLFGRPLAWTESGGNLGSGGKFVVDYQLVRGINYMNIRGINAAPATAPAEPDPTAASGWYITRSQYLMAVGRPAAQVALYHPSDSYWLGDQEADTVNVKLVTQLMERQVDFDHIDHDTLATICTLDKDGLKNLSGQVYRAVIVPTSTVIQKSVLDRLRAFAAAGGKVVFVGRTPTMVVDRTFLNAGSAPDLSFATLEPMPEITERVIAALPKPDIKLNAACAPLKYMHRSLKDGEVYFFFNESDEAQTRTATLLGSGQVQVWDAATGKIQAVAGVARASGSIAVPLTLGPQEARLIVIGPLPGVAATGTVEGE